MNGDPNQTSTKLRTTAVELIKMKQRPLASHEIETWIRENDKTLADLISAKCSDYVRIILSVTQDNCIVKYKSLQPIPGVDKRSTFYGLIDGKYNPSEWTPLNMKPSKNRKAAAKRPQPVPYQPPKPQKTLSIDIPDFDQMSFALPNDDMMVYYDFIDEHRMESLVSHLCIDNLFDESDAAVFDKYSF